MQVGCCILLQLVPDMVLSLCKLLWCFSSHQLMHNLHSWWSSPATCTGGFFSMPTGPFMYQCVQTHWCTLQLTLCGSGSMYTCVCVCVCVCMFVCVCVCTIQCCGNYSLQIINYNCHYLATLRSNYHCHYSNITSN